MRSSCTGYEPKRLLNPYACSANFCSSYSIQRHACERAIFFRLFSRSFVSMFPLRVSQSNILFIQSGMKEIVTCCLTGVLDLGLTYPLQAVLCLRSQALRLNWLCNSSFDLINHLVGGLRRHSVGYNTPDGRVDGKQSPNTDLFGSRLREWNQKLYWQ